MSGVTVAAVDLGASSGRVMTGRLAGGGPRTRQLELREVRRFPNEPFQALGTLHTDVCRLYTGLLDGLRAARRDAELSSVGIDSWGVDYGLLGPDGALLGIPVHYRDARTDGMVDEVLASIPAAELYAVTGIQQLPINTIYQLVAAARAGQLDGAATLLLMPDLLAYWLTGQVGAELTNASTTQLYHPGARDWAWSLIERLGLPSGLFPPIRQPGTVIGAIRPEAAAGPDLAGLPVVAVGSHDTASAVIGVPAQGRDFAYISCGTWSLVGMELDQPVLTEASRVANFTNEAGVDGTIRYLRNVMGLWLLSESVRAWADAGQAADLGRLLGESAKVPPLQVVVDPDDPVFLPPGDMPARIAEEARQPGSGRQPTRPPPSGASWTAWPWLTATPSASCRSCPGGW